MESRVKPSPAQPDARAGEWPALATARMPRYLWVARAVVADIVSGKYPVGSVIPTELALSQGYGVSRQTIRQALEELKRQGLISSHAGIGTTVRAKPQAARFVSGISDITELLQFIGETRTVVLENREVVADAALARLLQCDPGRRWTQLTCVRESRETHKLIGHIEVYLLAEHAPAFAGLQHLDSPFCTVLEREYGVRLAEVCQEVEAAELSVPVAKALGLQPGMAALRVVRQFFDRESRIVEVSVGHYPAGRYKQVSRFRVADPVRQDLGQ